jgi:Holliday junction resolvasome RuvABC ATP-dependent DNA helicase subunit
MEPAAYSGQEIYTSMAMLINDLAPQALESVYGQDPVKKYFATLARRPANAYRLHLIDGPYGTGKTSIARCFYKELEVAQDPTPVSFYDVNASSLKEPAGLEDFRQLLRENFDGYRVILLDEAHLAPPEAQASLLKDFDAIDYPLFVVLATTEANKLLEPLRDRFLDHYLSLFSHAEIIAYMKRVADAQRISYDGEVLDYIAGLSGGHLRTAVLQLDNLQFLGVSEYKNQMIDATPGLKELFTTGDAGAVDKLAKTPYHILTWQLEHYMFTAVIRAGELFKEHEIPKIFGFYIKHRRYLASMQDLLSFLQVLAGNIRVLRSGNRAR